MSEIFFLYSHLGFQLVLLLNSFYEKERKQKLNDLTKFVYTHTPQKIKNNAVASVSTHVKLSWLQIFFSEREVLEKG